MHATGIAAVGELTVPTDGFALDGSVNAAREDLGALAANVDDLYRLELGFTANPALTTTARDSMFAKGGGKAGPYGLGWKFDTYRGVARQSAAVTPDGKRGVWVRIPGHRASVIILTDRADFDAIKVALENAGFVYQDVFGVDCFLDGPSASPRDAIHLIFARERIRADHPTVSAAVTDAVTADDFQVVSLEALVRMKLNSFRRKDQVHLLDLLSVGLIDSSWLARLVPAHAARLQELIDDPEG